MIGQIKSIWSGFKYRGPSSSKDFNEFIENAFEDFTSLKRASVILSEEVANMIGKTSREFLAISKKLSEIKDSELDTGSICYADLTDRSVSSFLDRNDDEIDTSVRLYHNPVYGYVSLPCVYYDYLAVRDSSGYIVPDYVNQSYESVYEASDAQGDDMRRILSGWEREIWERVSILPASDTPTSGSIYIEVPERLMIRPYSNFMSIHPFPNNFIDYHVSYTTDSEPGLSSGGSSWNGFPDYITDFGATGVTSDAKNRFIQFPASEITAIKIDLVQRNSFLVDSSYVFSFGLRHVGLGLASPSVPSGAIRITVQKPSGNFTSVEEEAVITYLNLAAPYDTGNISSYCWIDSLDASKAHIELSIADNGLLSSPAGNALSYSPQISSIGIQYT